jgi:DNA-binding transcriptional ArsR family regulator
VTETDESVIDSAFAALANPTRRELLRLLREGGPLPVAHLASHFDMARPSVSEHLKVLRTAGLVREEKSGRHRYYHLQAARLREASEWLRPYEEFWREKLRDLRTVLDEESGEESNG